MDLLSRRETQIMEILYALGEASVGDVHKRLEDPPSYDSVRTILRILVEKGAAKRTQVDRKYIFAPTIPEQLAWKSFAHRLASSFFGGSMGEAALAMLRQSELNIDDEELERLERRLMAERSDADE